MRTKKIKAYAILEHNDKKPLIFGRHNGMKGFFAIFEKKKDALTMSDDVSWEIVSCEITYRVKIK